ncbi:sensor histidine kinase [Lichenihabitans psoromatis]|uniref:sensor histidine kinase n=1 Tax=Lichenihabitans psoromatis TaxID=2528642 RepID=UPI001036ABD8|nr:HAMP domain-containing sensor histidine kinase [Lichenihabitans psoromatis]
MTGINQRLFWKLYLTLLTSLTIVAVLMGGLWWWLGPLSQERWGAFRIHIVDQLVTKQDYPAGALADTIRRLGDEIGSDISLYDVDGTLLASRGTPITAPQTSKDAGWRPNLFTRIDLPDGRAVLVRLQHFAKSRIWGIVLAILVVAGGVGLGAFPLTARLTRRLENLRAGMERWGQGDVWVRVDDRGCDEVASVARTFNTTATRLNTLLLSQKALLANASHELRSPLTRLRMAVDLWVGNPEQIRRDEIIRNLAELDQLVEEILLCSRLDHSGATIGAMDRIDLLGLAAEEAARVGATLDGEPVDIIGNETLLRRLVRNLLENGLEHGRPPVSIVISRHGDTEARIVVDDRGNGVPPEERERIFEPFYRPGGRSEAGGGWGLGLSLVRQIAEHHAGSVICDSHEGLGSRFIVTLAAESQAQPDKAQPDTPATLASINTDTVRRAARTSPDIEALKPIGS